MPLQDAPNGGLREAQAPGDECVGVGNAGEVGDAPVFVVKDVELHLWGEPTICTRHQRWLLLLSRFFHALAQRVGTTSDNCLVSQG